MSIIQQIATSSEVVAMMKIILPATGSIMDEVQKITMKRNRRYYGYNFCASGGKATMDREVKLFHKELGSREDANDKGLEERGKLFARKPNFCPAGFGP